MKEQQPHPEQAALPGIEESQPLLPPPGTRAWQALALLAEVGPDGLTTPEAMRRGAGWRLAASIEVLKDLGWQINSLPVHTKGAKRPIARYRLLPRHLALAGRIVGG